MHRRVRHLNPAQCGAQIALDARFITGVADGAALGTWPARANSSISASQSGTSRPTYRASQMNGRPVVDFDGSDDFMSLSASALSLTNNAQTADITCVAVDSGSTDAGNNIIFFSTGASATSGRCGVSTRTGGGNALAAVGRRLDGDALAVSNFGGTTTSPFILSSRSRWSLGTITAMVNGIAASSANYSSGSGSTSATNSLAANIGAANASTARFNGDIASLIVAVPAFSDSVRARIRQSLGFSYRIATA